VSKLPNVDIPKNSDLLGLSGPGIKIIGPSQVDLASVFPISGQFVISAEKFEQYNGAPHRHLVLTVLHHPGFNSINPFRESLLFCDDVQEISDGFCGWFNLDVFAYVSSVKGTFHIRVSLGGELSDVIEAKVI
jgi:hypothetical protein